ncbi:unnamed protein product, partial [Ceratitis capitata]
MNSYEHTTPQVLSFTRTQSVSLKTHPESRVVAQSTRPGNYGRYTRMLCVSLWLCFR